MSNEGALTMERLHDKEIASNQRDLVMQGSCIRAGALNYLLKLQDKRLQQI